ncbi:hypothetical protein FHG89_23960 [Micromonospora orduensis]|uniref:SIR2-like domain-containing protein n=1 Tax=Micromonospora orduensis TaxID=1420891 RepID=A0A5C4QK19_9ACTN|nr:hypothetical protein [Micromonospora orduensis]TNH24943.1 hypothetical protein FHG89_23960 [Micromonospora orduensis]
MARPHVAPAAVFTGAGISGDDPAALPRGFGLRDDVLATMHEAARRRLAGLVTDAQLEAVRAEAYKLEVVLGRLWGTVGPDALDCVFALRVSVPNEAHMLAGLHLLRGGTHVTVNFDVGIELAYDLICGRADLPADAPRDYHDALPAWRALAPSDPPALLSVSSHEEFAAWLRAGRPPALLKVHGGLDRQQSTLADVVVVDIEELAQLTAERAAAVEGLGFADRLLITGYSGGDPDVYGPLLAAGARTSTTWCCLSLPAASTVPADARRHGIDLVQGVPDGLAVTALRGLLGGVPPPVWPSVRLAGDGYRVRFARWRRRLRAAHPDELVAQSWAWLIADIGDLDAAEAMLSALPEDAPGARLRHAEILYNRARGDDRVRAGRMFRAVAAGAADAATRLHCLLRLGDIARGRAARDARGVRIVSDLVEAYARPAHVIVVTRNGRRQPEEAGDAYRALQQTSLRLLERLVLVAPRPTWPVVAILCRGAAVLGGRAARLARNGNRLALVRQHRGLLRALAALLGGRPGPVDVGNDMRALRATYRAADDLPGAAGCAVTLAVLAGADGDLSAARALIAEALGEYAAGRPDGRPLFAGEALVDVATRLIDRLDGVRP